MAVEAPPAAVLELVEAWPKLHQGRERYKSAGPDSRAASRRTCFSPPHFLKKRYTMLKLQLLQWQDRFDRVLYLDADGYVQRPLAPCALARPAAHRHTLRFRTLVYKEETGLPAACSGPWPRPPRPSAHRHTLPASHHSCLRGKTGLSARYFA